MRVNACKNIDIDVELYVDIDDLLSEFFDRVDPAEQKFVRRLLPVLDSIMKILALVTDETIAAIPPQARALVLERMQVQTQRWELKEMVQ